MKCDLGVSTAAGTMSQWRRVAAMTSGAIRFDEGYWLLAKFRPSSLQEAPTALPEVCSVGSGGIPWNSRGTLALCFAGRPPFTEVAKTSWLRIATGAP